MGRDKLDDLSLDEQLWADPSEISDEDLDAVQEGFAEHVIEAIKQVTEDATPTERIVGVLISVVSIDKHHPATTEDATRYVAGAACITPPHWEKYEPPILAAGAKCMATLATRTIERRTSELKGEPSYSPPDMVRLSNTRIRRVEDLFELFSEECLENVPVMFPGVVADDMFRRGAMSPEATIYWPIVQHVTEPQQMPVVSETMADRMLTSWDDDTTLTLQALLYVNMNATALNTLDLNDPLFELCHLVCRQIHDDLETIILGAPEKLDA